MTWLKGVFWDVDGTLANTEMEGHRHAFNRAFADLGLAINWSRSCTPICCPFPVG